MRLHDPSGWLEMKRAAAQEANARRCAAYSRGHREVAKVRANRWYAANRERALAQRKRYRAALGARQTGGGQIDLLL